MGIYAVTGAASGIGKAVAEQLIEQGHEVLRVDLQGTEFSADLSDPTQRQSVLDSIIAKAADGLDGFIPCAGVGPECPKRELVPLVNYFAVVDMVNALLPSLKKKRGSVVLVSSNSSQMISYDENYIKAMLDGDQARAIELIQAPELGQAAYGGSKQALARWMRHNSQAFACEGVRINAIAPGFTQTGMTQATLDNPNFREAVEQFRDSVPVLQGGGEGGLPIHQAKPVLFLLSPEACYIAGVVLFIDGGHDAVFRPDRY